jgi:hypothetical protein
MEVEVNAIVKDMFNGKISRVEIDGEIFEKSGLRFEPKVQEEGEVYYDPKYCIHITQADINKVKIAICHVEYDWVADFKSIQKLTKISTSKLQRILHYMKGQKMIKMISKRTPKEEFGILSGKLRLNRIYETVDSKTNDP